jgi:hypothetical protein
MAKGVAVNLTEGINSVILDIDFSQFQVLGQLEPGDRGRIDLDLSLGLARTTALGHVWFVILQQGGRVPVDVEILAERPELDSDWDEVVELPFFSTRDAVIQGYDASMGTHSLGLVPRRNHRIRYSVANVPRRDDTAESAPGLYRLQFWPAEESPPAVLVSKTTWGQFAQYNLDLERAAAAASLLPEADRLSSYIDKAISKFPGDRKRALKGDTLASLASRYIWALKIGKVEETDIREMISNSFS